jgi:hypothetical protein
VRPARLSLMTNECVSVHSIESMFFRMRFKEDSLRMIMWSRHSRRSEPIKRSAYAFCHGDRGAVSTSRIPIAPLAAGMLLRKYNRDRAVDNAARGE